MDKTTHLAVIESEIESMVSGTLPNGAGTITAHRLSACLDKIAKKAFGEGQRYTLSSLLTTEEAAEILGVSIRRMRAIAKYRHDRFGIGWQIPGTKTWLFTPEEIDTIKS